MFNVSEFLRYLHSTLDQLEFWTAIYGQQAQFIDFWRFRFYELSSFGQKDKFDR